MSADKHGNVLATEGCTRCACGSKYWEHDRCMDCGAQATHEPTWVVDPDLALAHVQEAYRQAHEALDGAYRLSGPLAQALSNHLGTLALALRAMGSHGGEALAGR